MSAFLSLAVPMNMSAISFLPGTKHYFTNAAKRAEMNIPHYHVGGLVRYKLDEIVEWDYRHGGSALASKNETSRGAAHLRKVPSIRDGYYGSLRP